MSEEKSLPKLGYLNLKTKEEHIVRLLNYGCSITTTRKHLGKFKTIIDKETGQKKDVKNLFKPQLMYLGKTKEGVEYGEVLTEEEALRRHTLKYTTACADQDSDDYSEDCPYCRMYTDKKIKTLKIRKFLTGFLATDTNEIVVVNLDKPLLAEDIKTIKTDLEKPYKPDEVWIRIFKGKAKNKQFDAWRAEVLKENKKPVKVENKKKLNEELMIKYNLTNDDIDAIKDIRGLRKCFIPKKQEK